MMPKQESYWNRLSADELLALAREDCEPALAEMGRRAQDWREEWIGRLMHQFGLPATGLDESAGRVPEVKSLASLQDTVPRDKEPIRNLLEGEGKNRLGKALSQLSPDELNLWTLLTFGPSRKKVSDLFHIPVHVLTTLEIQLVKRINELLNNE